MNPINKVFLTKLLLLKCVEYYTKHQSDPPNNDGNPENRRMYSWCRKVREKYWDIKAGKTNNLTQEQIDKLTMWGFDWKTPDTYKQVVQKAPAKTWDEVRLYFVLWQMSSMGIHAGAQANTLFPFYIP